MELKEHRGFYYDNAYGILADATEVAQHIFGEGVVKKILYEFDRYYDYLDRETYVDYKDFIDKKYDELTINLKTFIDRGITIDDGGNPYMSIDGEDLFVEFINGVIINFNTSEWGRVSRL